MAFDFSSNETHVGTWHQDFGGFFGLKPRMRFGLTEVAPQSMTLTQDIGPLKAGTTMPLPAASNGWHATPLLAYAMDAEVLARDDLGRPCLWRTRRGEGVLWLFGFPVAHAPNWTNAAYTQRSALLREIFASAGIPQLEAQPLGVLGHGDENRRVWMNHAWAPATIQLPPGSWRNLAGAIVSSQVELPVKGFDVFVRNGER